MSGAVHPCFAPLTVSKHSSAVMSPTVWEPNLLSEVEVYQVRGEGGGAEKFLCVCVCVRGRASSCAVGADLICPTCEALIQVWTGPERSGACLVCGKRLQSPTCMRHSWKTRVSGKVWDTSVCLFANRLICLAVTLNEAVLVCGLYKRFHHLEGYKVTAEKLTDYMSGGFCTMQGQFTLGRMSVARFFTHFFWAN